jgi:hypothetical protein
MKHTLAEPGCVVGQHCMAHNEDEPDDPHYRTCGECFHVFRTPEELIAVETEKFGDHHREVIGGQVKPEMWSCPHCTHDF